MQILYLHSHKRQYLFRMFLPIHLDYFSARIVLIIFLVFLQLSDNADNGIDMMVDIIGECGR